MRDHRGWWVTKKIIFQHMSDAPPPFRVKSPSTPSPQAYVFGGVCVCMYLSSQLLYMVLLEHWGGWPCTPCPPLSRTGALCCLYHMIYTKSWLLRNKFPHQQLAFPNLGSAPSLILSSVGNILQVNCVISRLHSFILWLRSITGTLIKIWPLATAVLMKNTPKNLQMSACFFQ